MRTLFLFFLALFLANCSQAQASSTANTETLKKKYDQQLSHQRTATFEENKGQMKDQHWQPRTDVLFYGSSEGMSYYIRNSGMSYQLSRVETWKDAEVHLRQKNLMANENKKIPDQIGTYRVDAEWKNHNPNFAVEKGSVLAGYNNYYNVPEGVKPALFVQQYESVTLKNLWKGIDVHYYTTNGFLETDYWVAPGADYKQIEIEVKGAELRTDKTGNLLMKTPFGEIQEGKLKVYQNNELLEATWIITPTENGGVVSFHIPNYNTALALRIDPIIRVWGTYYGGSNSEAGSSCATDGNNNVYLAGNAFSANNISSGGSHQVSNNGSRDAFLVKFNAIGQRLWGTYYGGSNSEFGNSCATDNSGNVYLAGFSKSTSVIASAGSHQDSLAGGVAYDAFLAKFNSSGIRQWATYYGGSGDDYGYSCATDIGGDVYLAGYTNSNSGIASAGSHQISNDGSRDAFLVKFNDIGQRLWGTYYGDSGDDEAYSCATDGSGNVYLAGMTQSPNGMSLGGHQNTYGGGQNDAFLVKFNSTGVSQWATYYGGTANDWGRACATDGNGNVYLAGYTSSTNNISAGGHQNTKGNSTDAFLVKFNSSGVRQWGSYYGGNENDRGYSCATDLNGNVYLTGWTESTTGIAEGGYQNSKTPGQGSGLSTSINDDAFIAKFNGDGVRQWGSYYGGNEDDKGNACVINGNGNVYLAGYTTSYTNMTAAGHQNTHGGGSWGSSVVTLFDDAFIVKFKQPNITGVVWQDLNIDCSKDTVEVGMVDGLTLTIQPGNYVAQSIAGIYTIDSLPVGTYTVTIDTSNTNWIFSCPVSQTLIVTNPNGYTEAPSFGLVSRYPCPKPDVTIAMPRMRRGFSNQLIYVKACNLNTATDSINNAYVDVELPPFITVQLSSVNYTSLGNNKYRIHIGTLNVGQCEEFTLNTTISTASVVNQTLCLSATLFPQPTCVFDSIPTPYQPISPVSPCTLPWDKSSLRVSGECVGDSVRFVIYNTGDFGNGDMLCYSPLRLYVDGQLVVLDSIRIDGGDSLVVMFPGYAQTIRLEVDQHPLHPGHSRPNASIERCGAGNWTPGIINTMPQDDADPIVDIYCGQVTAPFDPNDKTGFPLGVGVTHNIARNQDIEYLIRFQNIGTDTAINVVIRDTLSTDLDIHSVQSGASSHPYQFSMYGQRVLEWRFNNIMLPDSNTNEPASNGFVLFKVKQIKDLQYGSLIQNTAAIYFDFEDPVITNTYFHTVSPPQQIISNINIVPIEKLKVIVSPNPMQNTATITIENLKDNTNVEWQLYDFAGRLMQKATKLQGNQFLINRNELSSGMYFYRIIIEGETVSIGKLLME